MQLSSLLLLLLPAGSRAQDACQTLAEAFLSACDTSSASGAHLTCPTGCMAAYTSFDSECSGSEWTEAVPGGFSDVMVTAFDMDQYGWQGPGNGQGSGQGNGQGPGGGNGQGNYPNSTTASVEPYVRFGTLVNHLADRCEWPGLHGTCGWHYILAIETAGQPPGEVLNYNCSVTADRDVCSEECNKMLEKTELYCSEGDTYTSSGFGAMAGMTVEYGAMMGALHVQSACHDFTCTSTSLGESFCSSLHTLSQSSATMYTLVNNGCAYTLSLINGLLSGSSSSLPLPYRAQECLTELSTGADADVIVQDICYCTDDPCPSDDREAGQTCTDGVLVPPPPPPPVAPDPPASSTGSRVTFGETLVLAFACALVLAF